MEGLASQSESVNLLAQTSRLNGSICALLHDDRTNVFTPPHRLIVVSLRGVGEAG